METFFKILGIILLLPIALTLVALAVITLIGGYVAGLVYFLWPILLVIAVVVVFCIIVKNFIF